MGAISIARRVWRAAVLAALMAWSHQAAQALPMASPVVIDFETEDDFVTPLVHGQSIYSTARLNNASPNVPFASDTVLEFGNLINISSTILGTDGHLGPAIFDSDPADTPVTGDPDLLVGLGNVLMLQRDENPGTTLNPTYGLVFNTPDDEATFNDRGSIVFDFLVPLCRPMTLDLVDIDENVNVVVVLMDNLGRERTYLVPADWTTEINESPATAGFHTLNLETLLPQSAAPGATGMAATASQDAGYDGGMVTRLEVQLIGSSPSGAIDNLVFSIVPEPATQCLAALAGVAIAMQRRMGVKTAGLRPPLNGG